ncbi:unnamed protein product, partial [marine sediment metagenome]
MRAMIQGSPSRIMRYVRRDDWRRAREAIMKELRECPDDHWLLTTLALTYYEEHRYQMALRVSRKAVKLAPHCPLVLWDYAGALDMVGREREAIEVWKKLLKRGVHSVAYGPCGEGLAYAWSLLNDSRYSIACSYLDLGKVALGIRYLRAHIAHR